MTAQQLGTVAEILSARAGEEMELSDRFLNPRWAGSCGRWGSTGPGRVAKART